MAVWSEGYFTDVEYSNYYFRELSPLFLNLNLTLAGYDIPRGGDNICPPKDFSYLELAFGCGGSINVHAATTNGKFVGTDFNPTQVAIARDYAVVDNVTLYDDSFKQLLERLEANRAEFDYIVFHGIFSWISQENRDTILEIVKKFLKVGGVVYNSYNCMPGWSAKAPSREILGLYKELYGSAEMDTQGLVKNALGFFEDFLSINPTFILSSPQNKELLQELKDKDSSYISHEYFNQNWDCFYFYQVAKMMERAKCSFAVSAECLDHFDSLNVRPEWAEFFSKIKNRIFKEQLKDYCANRQFRRDIYIKGGKKIGKNEGERRLMYSEFMLVDLPSKFSDTLKCVAGEMTLNKDLYQSVLKHLQTDSYRPKTIKEIMEKTNLTFSIVIEALMLLIQQGIVFPSQPVTEEIKTKAKAYNNNVLSKLVNDGSHNYLVAPAIASATITTTSVEQIILYAFSQGIKKESELINYTLKIFKEQNRGFIKNGKVLEKESDNKEAIKEVAKEFLKKIPLYQALGVLE